jgi:hypothetical protein
LTYHSTEEIDDKSTTPLLKASIEAADDEMTHQEEKCFCLIALYVSNCKLSTRRSVHDTIIIELTFEMIISNLDIVCDCLFYRKTFKKDFIK